MNIDQGDTFSYVGQVKVNQAVTDLSNWVVSALVKSQNNKALPITAGWVDPTIGKFYIRQIDTSSWPKGLVTLVISFSRPDGEKASSKPKIIKVI